MSYEESNTYPHRQRAGEAPFLRGGGERPELGTREGYDYAADYRADLAIDRRERRSNRRRRRREREEDSYHNFGSVQGSFEEDFGGEVIYRNPDYFSGGFVKSASEVAASISNNSNNSSFCGCSSSSSNNNECILQYSASNNNSNCKESIPSPMKRRQRYLGQIPSRRPNWNSENPH